MFETVRADLRAYRDYGYPGTSRLSLPFRLLYGHPASAAVVWFRFGTWAWRVRVPIVRQLCQFAYLSLMPLVRLYSGVQIHPTTPIGPGLVMLHYGAVIAEQCEIGRNCILHQNFNMVTRNERQGAKIGNNFYAGANVTIVGNLAIDDNVACGAGAVVTKSVPRNAIVVGVPARVIRLRREEEVFPRLRVGRHGQAQYMETPCRLDEVAGGNK